MTNEIEPIAPEEARLILDNAIQERLGVNWEDEGWVLVSGNDFMARLTRKRTNVDFYVDLLGSVKIEEKEINAGQDLGRLAAWVFLIASLIIALLIARIAGYL
ncbi:MAG: hypothetical protein HXY40_00730 [Chloroflexi bacterium]|nr:hypothetical protein [Chloroflexota bacterium]